MPIYRYRCPICEANLEVLAKMSDAPPACVECGHTPMVKGVARTAFSLKGGGWYAQGYAGSSSASSSKPTPAAAPAPSTSSDD